MTLLDTVGKSERRPEDYGLPPYPTGDVVGPCVCGSWPGGKCLKCPVRLPSDQDTKRAG